MRKRRCNHGFVEPIPCPHGCDLNAGIHVATFSRASYGSRPRAESACVLCELTGHVSKLCPFTEVGKRRLAERGAA